MERRQGQAVGVDPLSTAAPRAADPIETDAVIVGAGPVGLFQVFELGLLDIRAQVVDSLPCPGGQCIELYADKPIYDIPALPVCTGRELVDRLMQQIAPFGAGFHLGQQVNTVERQPDGRFLVGTSKGTRWLARTIFIVGGAGSFQPRTLKVEGIDRYEGSQLFYSVSEPALLAGRHVVITGDDDAALDWAIRLAVAGPRQPASVTLVHRRDGFRAAPTTVANMRALCAAGQMRFVVGQITGFQADGERLTQLDVTGADGLTHRLSLDALLVFLGLSPRLGPIAGWGLAMARKQLVVDTEKFQTDVPGIFAVGDINTYPGKKKLILSGFHEATLAAFGAATLVFPDQRIQLQYTTTSPKLHKLLGVEPPVTD